MKINITDTAAEQLKKMIRKSDQTQKKVRILLSGIGWGGPRFGIALDEQKNNDKNYKAENLDFVVEQELADQINIFDIDYRGFFLTRGFQVYADGYNASFC